MPDREKVMWSLARCSCGVPDACSDCYYDNWPPRICVQHLTNDALALLKAQEPRVVKISELTSGEPMLVWLEDIDKEETVAGMVFDYVPGRLGFKLTDLASRDRIYPRIEEYLTRWRCWTSRPTLEQMEATSWQGSSNL